MQFSFWERESWLKDIDYTIIGSGIVGLTAALQLRKKYKNAKIVLLERGLLPNGASTKNAGFACFGSISEILDDLKTHTEEEVLSLVQQRVEGLSTLRGLLGDETIEYQEHGGYELFTEKDALLYQECLEAIPRINKLLLPIFKNDVYSTVENRYGFEGLHSKLIFNTYEGQINTGAMMQGLLRTAQSRGIHILNNITVRNYAENASQVTVVTDQFQINTKKLLIATNGFASQLGITDVKPARAQVLITHPIVNLNIKGTFHLDRGYYYFRNIENRILLGGGRNLDFKTEETTTMGQTASIQNELERLLKEVILPKTSFTIDHRWSGIMGVGAQKKPIVKKISDHVTCGVRLGGMGIAIGSTIGIALAELVD